jgi:predicted Ser/Thr protein kinase
VEHFEISAEWRDALEKAGLGTLQSCLAFQEGKCLSSHLRGDTRKVTLTDGRIVFLKRDFFTFKKEIAKDLLRFKKPQPKTEKERLAFAMAREAGFIAPEVIAWGQTRRCGFPDRACLIMLPLDGVDLDKYLKTETDGAKRKSFIEKAEQTLSALQEKGFDWPDHKPEHFFVMNNGSIGLIDLERLQYVGHPLSEAKCASQLARFRKLLPHN